MRTKKARIVSEKSISLLLVPLDDIVVFPNMNVTLTVDVGDEERVLLVPKHEDEYAKVGTVAEVTDRIRLPGGGRAVALNGLHRGVAGAASSDAQGRLFVEVEERPDEESTDTRVRELEREYRAVVEEILELRGDDGRIAAFVRSITEPGALADTSGYSPDITFEQKMHLLETVDVYERLELALELQRERLALMQIRRRIQEDVETGRRQAAARVHPAPPARLDPKGARRGRGLGGRGVPQKIAEAEMPENVLEQAERELSRLERMGDQSPEASMIRNYLDWLLAVPWSKRSEERLDPKHTREVLDTDHAGLEDVKDRIVEYIAVEKLRKERGSRTTSAPAPFSPSSAPGHGQDLDRRVDRTRHRPRVRPDVVGRNPRRGRDPRAIGAPTSAHSPDDSSARCATRGRWSGDHARRGRQGRRRLARRPVVGAPRGARPGAEPLVPRPLPRRRTRPLTGLLHRDREHGRDDPRPAPRPHGGHPLRRVHDRREDRDREGLPLAAPGRAQRPARGRGLDLRRWRRARRDRVHARGGRSPARARARHVATKDRDEDRIRVGGGAHRARRRGRARVARPAQVLPRGRGANGCAWCRNRPRRDGDWRRRPLHRGDVAQGRRLTRAHRPAR